MVYSFKTTYGQLCEVISRQLHDQVSSCFYLKQDVACEVRCAVQNLTPAVG